MTDVTRQPFTAACPACGQDALWISHRDGVQGRVPDIHCPLCDTPLHRTARFRPF